MEPESTVVGLGVPGPTSGGHEGGAVVGEVDKAGAVVGCVGNAGGLRLCPPLLADPCGTVGARKAVSPPVLAPFPAGPLMVLVAGTVVLPAFPHAGTDIASSRAPATDDNAAASRRL